MDEEEPFFDAADEEQPEEEEQEHQEQAGNTEIQDHGSPSDLQAQTQLELSDEGPDVSGREESPR